MTATAPRPPRDRSHIAPVTTRQELIYLLSRASELEHGLACPCLFAAFSLKDDVSEGGLNADDYQRHTPRPLLVVVLEPAVRGQLVQQQIELTRRTPGQPRHLYPSPGLPQPLGSERRCPRTVQLLVWTGKRFAAATPGRSVSPAASRASCTAPSSGSGSST